MGKDVQFFGFLMIIGIFPEADRCFMKKQLDDFQIGKWKEIRGLWYPIHSLQIAINVLMGERLSDKRIHKELYCLPGRSVGGIESIVGGIKSQQVHTGNVYERCFYIQFMTQILVQDSICQYIPFFLPDNIMEKKFIRLA